MTCMVLLEGHKSESIIAKIRFGDCCNVLLLPPLDGDSYPFFFITPTLNVS